MMRVVPRLLLGAALCALGAPGQAQQGPSPGPQADLQSNDARTEDQITIKGESAGTVRALNVKGNERLERATILSYTALQVGTRYNRSRLDEALKALYATELFSNVRIRDDEGVITIEVQENPIINRIVLNGNKRLKSDKILAEIRMAPRQIFTRSKVRADLARILELYRRSGRFSARAVPKIVKRDQNRVDVVFEIVEGRKSKVRQINFLGNDHFSNSKLRSQLATKQARWWRLFSSGDTYDPDRLAYDQQKLRQFYLTEGYADFRVGSAVGELGPNNEDFILTFVVDEGERYKFGEIELESEIRDVKAEVFKKLIRIKAGDWYDAKKVEDTVTRLTETAGLLGYAFAEVRPDFVRDKENRVMSVNFLIVETPRVYVERIQINGNTITRDKVIRREFRLAEGDPFNSVKISRSRDRIQSLGYFQNDLQIEQTPGSTPDRIVLTTNLEDKPTGELRASAGFSSVERIILNLSVRQKNFRGMGQELRSGVSWSSFSRSIDLGFTEPYLFGRNLAFSGDIFRRDFRTFGFATNAEQIDLYSQIKTGFQVRAGFPLTEYWTASLRYGLSREEIDLADIYFRDGVRTVANCTAGVFICQSFGNYTVSSIGYTVSFDNLDNRLNPSRGHRFVFNQDVAGLGLGVRYLRTRANFGKFWALGDSGFIFSVASEGGHIVGWGGDSVRLTDRFFLGQPTMRGFAVRGVGPRSIIRELDAQGNPVVTLANGLNTPLGGNLYYLNRIQLEIPLGSTGRELGLRPSIFTDIGGLWTEGRNPADIRRTITSSTGTVTRQLEQFLGDTPTPRVSVGVGIAWSSPFGPVRFDFARALKTAEGDETNTFQFNIGTQF